MEYAGVAILNIAAGGQLHIGVRLWGRPYDPATHTLGSWGGSYTVDLEDLPKFNDAWNAATEHEIVLKDGRKGKVLIRTMSVDAGGIRGELVGNGALPE